MGKSVWRRYSVKVSNDKGTFKVDYPIRALNPKQAAQSALVLIGPRAFGELRVVSVHEIGG